MYILNTSVNMNVCVCVCSSRKLHAAVKRATYAGRACRGRGFRTQRAACIAECQVCHFTPANTSGVAHSSIHCSRPHNRVQAHRRYQVRRTSNIQNPNKHTKSTNSNRGLRSEAAIERRKKSRSIKSNINIIIECTYNCKFGDNPFCQ